MNSDYSFGQLTLFSLLIFAGNILSAQIPCGINSVGISPNQIVLCETPSSVDFTADLDVATDSIFLEGLVSTGDFQAPFIRSFETENNGCIYALKVVGSYSLWSNPMERIDALYRFNIATNQEVNLELNPSLTIPAPLYFEPSGYNENHEYWFYYAGDGQSITFDFKDSGQYSDNQGQMDFEWYVLPCYDTTWTILGADLMGASMRSFSFPNPGTFDVSLSVLDNLSGCMETAASQIKVSEKIETTVNTADSCPENDSGIATATITSGGTNPFQYVWDNGGMDVPAIGDLAPGVHQLIVNDAIGCSDTTDFVIGSKSSPVLMLESTDPNCEGAADGSIELLNPEPTWTFSIDSMNYQTDALFENLDIGNYTFFVQDDGGCIFSDTTSLMSATLFSVETQNQISITRGSSQTLKIDVIGGAPTYTYEWAPATGLSCSDCESPTAQPTRTTTYLLTVTDMNGCIATASITITVPEPDPNEKQVFIPNAFSPDNNGINDFLTVFSQSGVEQITTFAVFDRWGGLVFKNENFQPNLESEGWNGQWQGSTLNTGVYTWFAEIDWEDGVKTAHEGEVTLFRQE